MEEVLCGRLRYMWVSEWWCVEGSGICVGGWGYEGGVWVRGGKRCVCVKR